MRIPFELLFLILSFISCGQGDSDSSSPVTQESRDPLKEIVLLTPDDDAINTELAYTPEEQTDGLQYVMPDEFASNQGLLFFYLTTKSRTFWMPNTYFDLDLIYLNEELKITRIVRDLEHYPGSENSEIPRAPAIVSRHVLEMKSGSGIATGLRVGDQLRWQSPLTLRQTESEIRQRL